MPRVQELTPLPPDEIERLHHVVLSARERLLLVDLLIAMRRQPGGQDNQHLFGALIDRLKAQSRANNNVGVSIRPESYTPPRYRLRERETPWDDLSRQELLATLTTMTVLLVQLRRELSDRPPSRRTQTLLLNAHDLLAPYWEYQTQSNEIFFCAEDLFFRQGAETICVRCGRIRRRTSPHRHQVRACVCDDALRPLEWNDVLEETYHLILSGHEQPLLLALFQAHLNNTQADTASFLNSLIERLAMTMRPTDLH
jgi:hypothetical protein